MSKASVQTPVLASAVCSLLMICAGVFGAIVLMGDSTNVSRHSFAFGVTVLCCNLMLATIHSFIPEKKKHAIVGFVVALFLFAGMTYRILHGWIS